MFGNILQEVKDSLAAMCGVVALAIVFCVVARLISSAVRLHLVKSESNSAYTKVHSRSEAEASSNSPPVEDNSPPVEAEEPEWLHAVNEAEEEILAIIAGFVVTQTYAQAVLGRLPPVEGPGTMPEHNDFGDIMKMLHLAGACFTVLLLATVALTVVEHRERKRKEKWDKRETQTELPKESTFDVVMKNLQNVAAMCMSWCLLWLSIWAISSKQLFQNAHMDFVFTAFAVSAATVVVVIILDKVADQFEHKPGVASGDGQVTSQGSGGMRHSATVDDLEHATSEEYMKELHARVSDGSMIEKGLRTTITAMGLLVGLSWEKAFDMAHEAIIEGSPLHTHMVIAKAVIALCTLVVVIPAWQKYLVPHSKRSLKDVEALVQLEEVHFGNEQVEGSGNAMSIQFLKIAAVLEDKELKIVLRGLIKNRPQVFKQLQSSTRLSLGKVISES